MATEPTPSATTPARPYRPNALLRWLYRRFFAHIDVDEQWREVVNDAADRGVVVYVMRSLSVLDFVCLDYLVKRFGLPLVRFVNDLGLWILEPFGRGGRRLRLRRQVPEHEALASTVEGHYSAQLFLRRPPRFGRPSRKGGRMQKDLLKTLVATQRRMSVPVFLVPQTFVWSKLAPRRTRSLLDLLFGPVEWPGRIRTFFQFLFNHRNAHLRSGDPFNLSEFVAEHPDLTDQEIADKLRYALLRRMERERALVIGPTQKSPARIQEELLRSPRVRRHIASEARASGRPEHKVEAYARRELRRLCANQRPFAVAALYRILDWVWRSIYDGIVVDEEGVERLRAAMREGPVVLLPSHKSHVDYLVLSYVLYDHALAAPLIAAGENLSFWPLGPILRRGGAFFIRRSFRGRKLYAALVDAYLRKLLVEGFPIEFFLEGGRSRTGKLLPPKYGLMSMITDAALLLPGRKVRFVPISIGYERVVEERSYVHELSGGEKQKENLSGLLRTPKILRSKYGRLYVQLGEILDFDDAKASLLREHGKEPSDADPSPPERRALVQRLAHRTVYEIDRVTIVTPAALVATAMLSHRRRGLGHAALLRACESLVASLDSVGARIAAQLRDELGKLREDVVQEALGLFIDGKLVLRHDTGNGQYTYAVPEERRLALEYYKNTIVHFFVPNALISSAILVGGREPVPVDTLRERVRQLSRVFKYEFTYRVDASFDRIFDEALGRMVDRGEVERNEGHVRVGATERSSLVPVYAEMLRPYFEAYVLAVRSSAPLIEEPLARKEWVKRALAGGQRMYLAGAIERRESLSKPKLENALHSLRDHDLVRFGDEDTLVPGPALESRESLREVERELGSYLR